MAGVGTGGVILRGGGNKEGLVGLITCAHCYRLVDDHKIFKTCETHIHCHKCLLASLNRMNGKGE